MGSKPAEKKGCSPQQARSVSLIPSTNGQPAFSSKVGCWYCSSTVPPAMNKLKTFKTKIPSTLQAQLAQKLELVTGLTVLNPSQLKTKLDSPVPVPGRY